MYAFTKRLSKGLDANKSLKVKENYNEVEIKIFIMYHAQKIETQTGVINVRWIWNVLQFKKQHCISRLKAGEVCIPAWRVYLACILQVKTFTTIQSVQRLLYAPASVGNFF